jgi:hypothetical protein
LSALASPSFDESRKEIESFHNLGYAGASFEASRHRFERGQMVTIWEADQDQTHHEPRSTAPPDAILFTRHVRQRIDGRLDEVCLAIVDVRRNRVVQVLRGDAAACAVISDGSR